MKKLILHFQNILIGLSLFVMLSGCVLTEMDPPEKYYFDKYVNNSSVEISIIMIDITDMTIVKSFSISSGSESDGLYSELSFNGGDSPINSYLDNLIVSNIQIMELYVDGNLVKIWEPSPSGIFQVGVNNPYNSQSWVLESSIQQQNGVDGQILFEITDEDLGN